MDRAGTIACLIGLAVAFAGSLPLVASVIGGTSTNLAGAIAWQAWALGGVIAFVGVGLIAATDRGMPRHFHGNS